MHLSPLFYLGFGFLINLGFCFQNTLEILSIFLSQKKELVITVATAPEGQWAAQGLTDRQGSSDPAWQWHGLRQDHPQRNPCQDHLWGPPVSCTSSNAFPGDTHEGYDPDFCSRRWWQRLLMCCRSGPTPGPSEAGEWSETVCLPNSSPCSRGSADEMASWPSSLGLIFPSLGSESVGKFQFIKWHT